MKLEDYSTYLGYILIGILLFLIIRTLVNKGKSKEGFLGLGESDSIVVQVIVVQVIVVQVIQMILP
jgi:hypothetical protein